MASHTLFADRRALEQEVAALGVEYPVRTRHPGRRSSRCRSHNRTVGNRFAIHPMEGCDGTLDGAPDELTFRRWARFGAGGAKLLWGEAVAIDPDARANTRQLLISEQQSGGARAADRARRGRSTAPPAISSSAFSSRTRADGRIRRRPSCFTIRRSAITAASSPTTNSIGCRIGTSKRRAARATSAPISSTSSSATDTCCRRCSRRKHGRASTAAAWKTGRDSFASCCSRLTAEVPDLIRGSRMNFFDGVPYAKNPATGIGEPIPGATENYLDADDAVEALKIFRDAGLQLVNVTAGCPYFNPHVGRPADKEPPDGYGAPENQLVGVARHFRSGRSRSSRVSGSAGRRNRLQLPAAVRRRGR